MLSMSVFVVLGLLKMVFSVTFFFNSKTLFGLYLSQGVLIILYTFVNEDVSAFGSTVFAILTVFVTAATSIVQLIFKSWSHKTKKVFAHLTAIVFSFEAA